MDVAALLEKLARQVFDRLGGVLDFDVDVEAGCKLREHAGVLGEEPELGPQPDLSLGAVEFLCPFLHRGHLAHARQRGESVGTHAQAKGRDVFGHDECLEFSAMMRAMISAWCASIARSNERRHSHGILSGATMTSSTPSVPILSPAAAASRRMNCASAILVTVGSCETNLADGRAANLFCNPSRYRR